MGKALIRTLRQASRAVRGIDVLPSPFTEMVGSIVDREFVPRSMEGVGAVLHTATLHTPHEATHTRQQFIDVNVTGTPNLLRMCGGHPACRQ